MVGIVSNLIGYSNLNMDSNLGGHELPFIFNTMNKTNKKVPQLTKSVIESFGKVLDIFEEPLKLRDPEFDNTNLNNIQNFNEKNKGAGLVENDYKPSPFEVEYLGKRTKAHYDRVESTEDCVGLEVDKERLKVSASPCPEDFYLCGRCFMSLASLRCDSCMVYYCGLCANAVHSDLLNKSHVLLSTKGDRKAQFHTGSENTFDLSIPLNKDLVFPSYEYCEFHPKHQLKFSCATCHFLPICTMCASEVHKAPGSNHKVVELEVAVTEVKEFMNDCLSALVNRHNSLSPLVPDLEQLSHLSNASVYSSERSFRCSSQSVKDALKVKHMLIEGEIKNLQQLGTSNLNRLVNLSNTYNKYLLRKIDQLKKLTNLKDPGLALNAFVELRPNFEQLLYNCEDLPDLALEIPHWQLNVGNLPNLLSDVEYRINNRCEELNSLCNQIVEESNKASTTLESVLLSKPDEDILYLSVDQSQDVDIKKFSELRGQFTRKDYVHRIPCKRAVTLRDQFLYVYGSDSHFEDASLESKIDLSAVTVKSFDEEDVTEPAKLARIGSPNGFEIVERKKGQMRFWLFTSESRNLVLLWVSKLKKLVSEYYKVDLSYFGINENFVLPIPPKLPQEYKIKKHEEYEANKPSGARLKPTLNRTLSNIEPPPDFKHVSQTLKRIKEDSSLLYDKCFSKKNDLSPKNIESSKPKLELVEVGEHQAEIPDTSSETSSSISAGRYELPTTKFSEKLKTFKPEPISFKCVDLPEFEYSPQVTSPKSIHKFFQQCSQKN